MDECEGKEENKSDNRKDFHRILVVSDTHFGHKNAHPESLSQFIDHIWTWKKNPPKVKKRELYFPSTIILLGDIFEMWIPRGKSRYTIKGKKDNDVPDNPRFKEGYIFFDTYPPLQKLLNLGCDIIYVAGNHDINMARYSGKYSWEEFEALGSVIKTPNLTLCANYFPKRDKDGRVNLLSIETKDESDGRTVENYAFMHGHQFDKMFLTVVPLWKSQAFFTQYSSVFYMYAQRFFYS